MQFCHPTSLREALNCVTEWETAVCAMRPSPLIDVTALTKAPDQRPTWVDKLVHAAQVQATQPPGNKVKRPTGAVASGATYSVTAVWWVDNRETKQGPCSPDTMDPFAHSPGTTNFTFGRGDADVPLQTGPVLCHVPVLVSKGGYRVQDYARKV